MSKEKLKERVEHITEMVRDFCGLKLNEEYFSLSEKLIGKLKRKRPSPLLRGKEEIWAASIVHAIGYVNFLYDKSFEPHLSFDEVNDFFGTKKSSVGSKSSQIRNMFKLNRLGNYDFMTTYIKNRNPLYNMVLVNDLIIPISELPEEYQKLVKEARDKGEDIQLFTK